MGRKKTERNNRGSTNKPDDYFNNGIFEMARFGKNVIVKNNRTPEEQTLHLEGLREKYPTKYDLITTKVLRLKEKILCCDPFNFLMYLKKFGNYGANKYF
jgi:hypothetical protein